MVATFLSCVIWVCAAGSLTKVAAGMHALGTTTLTLDPCWTQTLFLAPHGKPLAPCTKLQPCGALLDVMAVLEGHTYDVINMNLLDGLYEFADRSNITGLRPIFRVTATQACS
jgi:hypothetical protein